MKGYKGFAPGMVCRGKQYAENTTFEEDDAKMCASGMHFCENPFAVLDYYPYVNEKAEINDFAEVEGENVFTDGEKSVTKKLKIGAKIGIPGLVRAFVEYTIGKIDKTKRKTNTGDQSAASVNGDGSVAIVTGYQSKAKGEIGCAIVICERREWNGQTYPLLSIKSGIIDGKRLKPDVWYTVKNGRFVRAEQ